MHSHIFTTGSSCMLSVVAEGLQQRGMVQARTQSHTNGGCAPMAFKKGGDQYKIEETLPFLMMWMELEGITLKEIRQTEKHKCSMVSPIHGILK